MGWITGTAKIGLPESSFTSRGSNLLSEESLLRFASPNRVFSARTFFWREKTGAKDIFLLRIHQIQHLTF